MSDQKYFDLHTSGIGYLNRVREVKQKRSDSFWATDIAALSGASDDVQYTRFDCIVVGTEAKRVIASMKQHVDADKKVLVDFKLGDLYAETFTYGGGKKAGETGISLKSRLLRIGWVKVDGEMVYTAPEPDQDTEGDNTPESNADQPANDTPDPQAGNDDIAGFLPGEVRLSKDEPDFEVKKARLKQQGYRFDGTSNVWKLPQAA